MNDTKVANHLTIVRNSIDILEADIVVLVRLIDKEPGDRKKAYKEMLRKIISEHKKRMRV